MKFRTCECFVAPPWNCKIVNCSFFDEIKPVKCHTLMYCNSIIHAKITIKRYSRWFKRLKCLLMEQMLILRFSKLRCRCQLVHLVQEKLEWRSFVAFFLDRKNNLGGLWDVRTGILTEKMLNGSGFWAKLKEANWDLLVRHYAKISNILQN